MVSMDATTPMDDGMVAEQGVTSDRVVRVYGAGTEGNTELRAHTPGPAQVGARRWYVGTESAKFTRVSPTSWSWSYTRAPDHRS